MGFDYAQKHSVELECAQKIASLLQLPYEIIPLDFLENITRSALFKNSNDLIGHSHRKIKIYPILLCLIVTLFLSPFCILTAQKTRG